MCTQGALKECSEDTVATGEQNAACYIIGTSPVEGSKQRKPASGWGQSEHSLQMLYK